MKERVEVNKRLIAINSFSGIVSKILNIILLIWLNQFLIKNISIDEYSIYPVAVSFMMFVAMLKSVLSGGLSRHVTEAYAEGDITAIEEITSVGFVIQVFGALILGILTVIFISNIDTILHFEEGLVDDAKITFGIMICSFIIRQLFVPFEAGLQVKQKFVAINIFEFSGVILRILIILICFKYFEIRIVWVVVATEVANFYGLIFRMYLSKKYVSEIKFKINRIRIKRIPQLLSFSLWLFIGNCASRIQSSADPIFLNRFSDSFNVTCFHIGSLFRRQIQNIQNAVVVTFMPAITAMHVKKDYDKIKKTFMLFGKYYTWAYMMVALPLIIYRNDFINLYIGAGYSLASKVMILLLLDSLFIMGSTLTYFIAMAINNVKNITIMKFIVQVINLGLTTYFVAFNRMGALGSALATFVTNFVFSTVLVIPIAIKMTGVSKKEYVLDIMKPGFIPSAITVLPLLLIHKLLPINSWVALFLHGVLSTLIYIAIIYFVVVEKKDKAYIKKIISKKSRKL